MFRSLWLTSLARQLRSQSSRSTRTRRHLHHGLRTPSAQALVSRKAVESLEDRTLLTAFTVVNTDDSGAGSLRDAIEQANANEGADTISFDAALAGETFRFTEQLKILDELSIVGLGADQMIFQIDGGSDDDFSLIFIEDYDSENLFSVDISGISFDGVGNGRAIYSMKNLTVTDCQFTNLSVRGNGGAISAKRYLTVHHSSFSNNESEYSGGAIYHTIANVDFRPDFYFIVTDSYFYKNIAGSSGGGVCTHSATQEVLDGYSGLQLSSSTFIQNESSISGGGVAVLNGWMDISDSKFISNTSVRGGGLSQQLTYSYRNTDTASKVSDCDFIENSASYGGGGFYQATWSEAIYELEGNERELTIAGCDYRGNTAGERGGGMCLTAWKTGVTILDTVVSGNSSDIDGGGVFTATKSIFVDRCLIDNNFAVEAGGGIHSVNNLRITNSTLSNNTTEKWGGAIYSSESSGSLTISACTVVLNSAGERGGGVYVYGSSSYYSSEGTNSIIAGNVANYSAQAYGSLQWSNCIQQDTVAGLLDPVLRDNGGNTKTHALLPGSLAIDAGDNSYVTNAGIEFDQRSDGHLRIVNGTVDIGAFEVQGAFTQIDLRVVDSHTATDENGELNSLPQGLDWINEWGGYWLEIWLSTPTTTDLEIFSAAFDLSFDTTITTATAIEYGAAFTVNQAGKINDLAGSIENLSAETSQTNVGDDQHVLFARIRFESTINDAIDLDFEGQTLNPLSPAFSVNHPEILFTGSAASEEVHGLAPETAIYANPFDLNDDDVINYRDLIQLVNVYGDIPSESSSDYAWFADYDRNDRVNYRDLIQFVGNYGKSKANANAVSYPANFPFAWNQLLTVETQQPLQTTAKSVTQAAAESMLESAKADLSPQLDSEQQQLLSEVDVQVVDLAGDTLGRAVPGTIYIDVNAAGYGWFVDATPADNSEFSSASELSLIALPDSEAAGHVDLWTVILHELGHLLGYEHADVGAMQESLSVGERRLVDWESETDAFFGTLTDDAELSVF